MRFIIAYFKGWWLLFRKFGMWLLLFLFNFIFAVVAAFPLYNLVDSKLSNSKAIEKLLPGLDFTIFQDFMNQFGRAVIVIMNQSVFLTVLYLLFSIFLTGGILEVFKWSKERFSFRTFWSGCTYYFWRLLRLTIYFLIIHGLFLSLFIGLVQAILGNPADWDTEVFMYDTLKIAIPIYLFFASIFFMIHDYAKIHIVHQDKGFLMVPFWQSFGLVFKNFFPTFFLYLLNLLTFIGILAAYLFLNPSATETTEAITLSFAIGQAFIFARIGTKLLNLGSATLLYQNIMVKHEIIETEEKEVLIAEAVDQVETEIDIKKERDEIEKRIREKGVDNDLDVS